MDGQLKPGGFRLHGKSMPRLQEKKGLATKIDGKKANTTKSGYRKRVGKILGHIKSPYASLLSYKGLAQQDLKHN
jgi:hypothetical protein